MRPTKEIETLLSETPVPGLSDGPHRAALKRELLNRMEAVGRRASPGPGEEGKAPPRGMTPRSWRPILRPQWIVAGASAAAALVAVSAALIVAKRNANPVAVGSRGPAPLATTAPARAGGRV